MGNSNSQLKRSRSQYGSSRSVEFSLPSTWDRRSYAYGEPVNRRPSSASSVRSLPGKSILRTNSSISSLSHAYSGYDRELRQRQMSRSMHSLPVISDNESDRRSTLSRPTSMSNLSANSGLTRREYSDIYLRNDLRRVFRSQDRSNSVAQLPTSDRDVDYIQDSTASLDRKLIALKAQRTVSSETPYYRQESEEPRREGAAQRRIRSRKSKLAPPAPSSVYLRAREQPITRPESKPIGLYRKKSTPAPQPPLRVKSQSLPSLNKPNTELHQWQNSPQQSLIQEIEAELKARRNSSVGSAASDNITIPRPDYDYNHSSLGLNKPATKPKRSKLPAPPVPKPSVVSPSPVAAKIPRKSDPISTHLDLETSVGTIVVAEIEVHQQPSLNLPTSNTETMKTDNIPKQAVTDIDIQPQPCLIPRKSVSPPSKEVREIAIQYDAPVEIAIQCTGNTLRDNKTKTNPSSTPDTSLTELLQLFNEAIQAGKQENGGTSDISPTKSTEDVDNQSESSSGSSSRDRNSSLQKVVPLHEVLAGVPVPPPLPPPDFNVRLIQTRTIKENAPVSMAPDEKTSVSSAPEDENSSPRRFASFQQELLQAYEKIEEKRKSNPESFSPKLVKRQISDSSSEANALKVYRHASTIIGVQTPQEAGSDSGHDEPSDISNSQPERPSSMPDFVLAEIAKNFHSEYEISTPRSLQGTTKSSKSKFNSIRRLKQSVKQFISPKHPQLHVTEDLLPDYDNEIPTYSNENWTLSGRSRSSRSNIAQRDTFTPTGMSSSLGSNMDKVGHFSQGGATPNPKSSSQFKQTNMKSFALLTPMGYPGSNSRTTQSASSSPSTSYKQTPDLHHRVDNLADVPL